MAKKKRDQSRHGRRDARAEDDLEAAIAAFKIDAPELSPAIKSAAFRSGGYPYDGKMDEDDYARELLALQIELLKVQDWVRTEGERVVVVFEGRDASGKGGAIQRLTQHLNPRMVRHVALAKPTETEQGQWYFQRYIAELPTRGEIVLFDRSWYNRAGVERVMGFCTPEQTEHFLHEVPIFEAQLVRDGIHLIKIYLNVGHAMQLKRLHARYADPLKRWKLSPVDFEAIGLWGAYSDALDEMIEKSDTPDAPWAIVKANDKLRTRLAILRQVLLDLPYPDKDEDLVGAVDRSIVLPAKAFLKRGGEL